MQVDCTMYAACISRNSIDFLNRFILTRYAVCYTSWCQEWRGHQELLSGCLWDIYQGVLIVFYLFIIFVDIAVECRWKHCVMTCTICGIQLLPTQSLCVCRAWSVGSMNWRLSLQSSLRCMLADILLDVWLKCDVSQQLGSHCITHSNIMVSSVLTWNTRCRKSWLDKLQSQLATTLL